MKKSDLDVQNENAILLAIAIADGYFPVNKAKYDIEFSKKMKMCGIDDYKEAFNYVYAGMPQFVGDDAIYSGKISLKNKDKKYLDLALGNNEQTIDDYNNVPVQIVSEYINKYLPDSNLDINAITKDKYSLYNFLITYVAPQLLSDRLNIRLHKSTDSTLENFVKSKALDTLFDYKFSAFKHREQCRGNRDMKYYSLAHGMLDSVCDFYGSIVTATDERDIDIRAISPHPNEELGIELPENFME